MQRKFWCVPSIKKEACGKPPSTSYLGERVVVRCFLGGRVQVPYTGHQAKSTNTMDYSRCQWTIDSARYG
jgi:hypothetical protein